MQNIRLNKVHHILKWKYKYKYTVKACVLFVSDLSINVFCVLSKKNRTCDKYNDYYIIMVLSFWNSSVSTLNIID